jgi:hypothetical protein
MNKPKTPTKPAEKPQMPKPSKPIVSDRDGIITSSREDKSRRK